MKIGIVGATGLVGREILKVLEEFKINEEILLSATEKSIGKKLNYFGREVCVKSIDEVLLARPDIVVFSAGSEVSKLWAEKFTQSDCWVIDNSSAWRLEEYVPLVVPEVNIDTITEKTKLIANPNCSTIQLVVVLSPLHKINKIKRVTISTYQSVSGSGQRAIEQLKEERQQKYDKQFYPHRIDLNCFPFAGQFLENGYTSEEMKLVNETQKILNDYNIEIAPTVVRIPVLIGHSESVSIEFEKNIELSEVRDILQKSQSIVVNDNPSKNLYPMPIDIVGKNEVFVGRIRHDLFRKNCIHLWIVADNLRKGAATNAVQIAKYIKEKFL